MAFVAKNPFRMNDFSQNTKKEVQYPAEFHFRIITEPSTFEMKNLRELLGTYQVTNPVRATNASSSGRFQSYGVSVLLQSKERHAELDQALKALPGVRLVL